MVTSEKYGTGGRYVAKLSPYGDFIGIPDKVVGNTLFIFAG